MEATWCLTSAINGVQEVPPEKMAAIHNHRALLLGEVPLQEPESPTQTCRPKEPLTVSPQAKPKHDDALIIMWDATADKTRARQKSCPSARLLMSSTLTMIQDIIDEFVLPPDIQRHETHCPWLLCAPTPRPAHHQEPTQGAHGTNDKLCNFRCTYAQASHGQSKHTPNYWVCICGTPAST
jgi:hypothetical protein